MSEKVVVTPRNRHHRFANSQGETPAPPRREARGDHSLGTGTNWRRARTELLLGWNPARPSPPTGYRLSQCQWFQAQVSRGDRDRWPAVGRGQPSIRLPPQNELSPARSRQTDRTL